MWKHEIIAALGVCRACGRLPARELPLFGLRCEIAVEQWDLAQAAMRGLVEAPDHTHPGNRTIAVGRAPVPPKKN